jgi:flagellar biogenesis protein FliO
MEGELANVLLGTITGGLIIILGFVLGVLWASRWD